MRLSDLKTQAQEHYRERLDWTTEPWFGGSAWADVDHHVVSVMVDPPTGNPHIAEVWPDGSRPLPETGEMEAPTLEPAMQMVMQL